MLLVAREDTLPLPWLQLVNRVASVEDGLGKETPVTLAAAPNVCSECFSLIFFVFGATFQKNEVPHV